MAQRGKPSIAHEFNERNECIHCGMYRNNVERLVHVCKAWREDLVDEVEAKKMNVSLLDYRRGVRPSQTT